MSMALELDSKAHAHFSFSQSFLFSLKSATIIQYTIKGRFMSR